MAEVCLDNLPRNGLGINWKLSIGCSVKLICDDKEYVCYILNYDSKTRKVTMSYSNTTMEIRADRLKSGNVSKLFNNIFLKNNELAKCIINAEYQNLTSGSHKKVDFRCPKCGNIHNATIKDVFSKGLPCRNFSDGISYPEKYMYSFLKQSGVEFCCQKYINGYYFDFYVPKFNIAIETDGRQHFDKKMKWYRPCIDERKNVIAENNNIILIRVDCQKSDAKYIKHNIETSHLANYFDMNVIDWSKCNTDATKRIIYSVAELYNNEIDIDNISLNLKLHRKTIIRYLERASEIGLCNFDKNILVQKREQKRISNTKKSLSKKVIVVDSMGKEYVFDSIQCLCRKSKDMFGVRFSASKVSNVANGVYGRKTHKGFVFRFA